FSTVSAEGLAPGAPVAYPPSDNALRPNSLPAARATARGLRAPRHEAGARRHVNGCARARGRARHRCAIARRRIPSAAGAAAPAARRSCATAPWAAGRVRSGTNLLVAVVGGREESSPPASSTSRAYTLPDRSALREPPILSWGDG